MANFVDVPKLIHDTLKSQLEVPVYRKPPQNSAKLLPWVTYQITSPQKVSNAAFARGVSFTLVLNVLARDYPGVVALSDEVLAQALSLPRVKNPVGKISQITVTSGPEDATTSLGASEVEQMVMTLQGIARKE